jgi:exosortase/archaeosortase family protein
LTAGLSAMVDPRRMSRPNAYLLALAVAFLAPLAIPNVGIDSTYFFIFILVFFAWLIMKWSSFENLTNRSTFLEVVVGLSIVAAVYAEKVALSSEEGLLDMVIIFSALALAFFGIRSFKLFWVPALYGVVLLLGYQVENDIPNYVALQDWMAGLMASGMSALGVASVASGHVVALNSNSGSPLLLDVESDCTGIQGVLAFGLLSSMALVDVKPKLSRLIPIFVIGFVGVFLINILRLFLVFLAFEYLGISIGEDVHVYAGYTLFVIWILIFWSLAFKYMPPRPATVVTPVIPPGSGGVST